jgi:AAA domain
VSVTYIDADGRRLIDCQNCNQAARIELHGDRLSTTCYAGCDQDVTLGEYDLDQLRVECNGGYPGESVLLTFDEIVARPVRWVWRDRVALSKITALAGRPKIGKGLLYSHLIAQVTRGTLDGDLDGPRDVILVTTEDDPGDTLKPRLMAAGADLSRVSMLLMGSKDDPIPFRVPQDAAELGRRAAEKNAALVVIDPLMEFVDGKVDSHKSQPVRQAIAALNQIARERDCAVLVIFHLNKGVSSDPLLRHEGSAAFTQVVRGGLMLGHDPDDPEGEDGRQRVLAVSSSNLAAIAPSLVYRIDTARVVGDMGEEIVTAEMSPIGESSVGAHDLLRERPDEDEQTGTDEAEELLAEELAEGPRPASEVTKQARQLSITEKQLRTARRRLGVESRRVGGGGRRGAGHWEWSLPEAPSIKAPSIKAPSSVEREGHLNQTRILERTIEAPEAPKTIKAPLSERGRFNPEEGALTPCDDSDACIVPTRPTAHGWRCKTCDRYVPRPAGEERWPGPEANR